MIFHRATVCVLLLLLTLNARATPNSCSALKGVKFPTGEIGLPTKGGRVLWTHSESGAGGGYCRALGVIISVDSQADPIRFEVNLPVRWNGQAVQFGGGGFDGYLRQSDGRGATVVGDQTMASPLARGYATFGSDSGHHHHYWLLPDEANLANSSFARNDEERRNFASDALKKAHDVALILMRSFYGVGPRKMYFIGGSNGGREALKAVDRWPLDYDGVVAAYASWNQIETDLQFIRVTQAIYTNGRNGQSGWMPPAKTRLLRDAVLNACDAQDGLVDHIISDPAHCHFDPAAIRCVDGMDRKGCLSDGQERTVEAFSLEQVTAFSFENGMNREPGYNILRGGDLVGNMGWLHHPFRPAIPYLNSIYYVFADGIVRTFLSADPHLDLFTLDTSSGGPVGQSATKYLARGREQSVEDDASRADLSPFERHGGKLLLVHGVADSTVPTNASVLLYNRVVAAMGQERADGFIRLYLIPGFGHGVGVFRAGFDTVGVLDRWVNDGIAPGELIAKDQNKRAKRTRPMCMWPSWPRFTGVDPDLSTSFTCTLPQ